MVKLAEEPKSIYDIAHNLICGKLRELGHTGTPDEAIDELMDEYGADEDSAVDAAEYVFYELNAMSGTFRTEEEADENARKILWFMYQER
jgi:hypothetical protein